MENTEKAQITTEDLEVLKQLVDEKIKTKTFQNYFPTDSLNLRTLSMKLEIVIALNHIKGMIENFDD